MRKVIFAILVVALAAFPVMADENWVGVDLGVPISLTWIGESDAWTEIGMDATVRGAFYLNRAETIGVGVGLGFDFALAQKGSIGDFHNVEHNIFTLSPAVSFQYRLELNRDMDIRLGAGLMYSHHFIDTGDQDMASIFEGSLKITANADFVYKIDDIGIIAGADVEMAVWNFTHSTFEVAGIRESDTTTIDSFGLVITPKVGVSYSF